MPAGRLGAGTWRQGLTYARRGTWFRGTELHEQPWLRGVFGQGTSHPGCSHFSAMPPSRFSGHLGAVARLVDSSVAIQMMSTPVLFVT